MNRRRREKRTAPGSRVKRRCLRIASLAASLSLLMLGSCTDCGSKQASPEAPPSGSKHASPSPDEPVAPLVEPRRAHAVAAPMPEVVLPDAPPKAAEGEPGRWAFAPEPDRFEDGALLDLRYLNEERAGQHGFVGVDDAGDFVRGDGEPLRFWAAHSGPRADLAEDREHARWMAKRGVNLVRWHGNLAPKKPGTALSDFDESAREGLWRYVAAMKDEGIYTVLSPYWAHPTKVQPGWGIDSPEMNGLLFFHPGLQAAYKGWLRAMLVPENPHTGVALKDEPAVAVLQVQNEDSLLFWTMQNIQGAELKLLQERFANFARKHHGSLKSALSAWKGASVDGDMPEKGRLGLSNLFELTSMGKPGPDLLGGMRARRAFQARFLAETMRDWNAEVQRFLREDIGAQQLVNAGNWRTADPLVLNDLERYSYLPNDVVAVNRYVEGGQHNGPDRGWAIAKGDTFQDGSVLLRPTHLPVALKQVVGRAMLVTESNWVPPMGYRSEGPFLVSAYGSLTGVDALFWYQHYAVQFRQPSSANGFKPSIGKWVAATPEIAGNYPANALIARNGYVKRGEPAVVENRALDDLFARTVPVISEEGAYDPNRDEGDFAEGLTLKQEVDRLAFLVGPVLARYGTEKSSAEVKGVDAHIDDEAKVVRSNTDELRWDYGRGLCTLDAPQAQGVTGALAKVGTFELGDVILESESEYATVQVVSLDTEPLATSKHVLVQAGTLARPSGWKVEKASWEGDAGRAEGYRIVEHGQAPWQVVDNATSLSIRNPHLSRAIALDMNGMAREEVPVTREGDSLRLSLPKDAKYVILR